VEVFDPDGDSNEVFKVLSSDSELLTLLGWTTGKTKSSFIWKATKSPDLTSGGAKICYYFAPSRTSANALCSIEVVQFDVYVPSTKPQLAYQIQKRVKELVHMKTINGRQMWWAGQLGDLPAPAGYVCLGVRYRYSIVV
jgi:hypothetical protein